MHACYDFLSSHVSQKLVAYGTYESVSSSAPPTINITANSTSLSFPFTASVSPIQAGGLLSFDSNVVVARFGVSFLSADQACNNAEEEVPDWNWDSIQAASKAQWEDVLQRVIIDTKKENSTVVELLYSSVGLRCLLLGTRILTLWQLYRASLVPANLTGENPYWTSKYPFFDALFW